jgi:uncharacterized protein YoxC/energy-coupling factor transporter ATP-binding protein EcfA2
MGEVIEDLLKDFVLRPEEFMFFLGAGFSKEIGLPSEQELAESLAKKYGEEKIQGALDDVIESLLKKKVDRGEICKAIKEEFNKRESAIEKELPRNEYNFLGIFFRIINQVARKLERENSPHQVIIATTNWDDTMKFFEKKFKRKVLSIYSENQVKSRETASRRIIVYHLYGSIEDCNSMILTKEEKSKVSENKEEKSKVSGDTDPWQSFTADVDKHRVIFIGCSTADEDILGIYMKSRKGATINEKKDYIIVNDEGSRRRIEDMLAKNNLDGIANVVVMDSFGFLKELAKSVGLLVEEPKVELNTEKEMMKKLKEKGSVIVVGPRLSGLTTLSQRLPTLYQNYFIEFHEKPLCLEYDEYGEDSKKSFTDLMNNLEKEKIVLIAPEYLYEKYFEEYKSRIKDENRLKNVNKLVKEITIKHMVSREEARKYLEELIKTVHKDYKDKFSDNELKDKILDSVEHEGNYPLKLLRDAFQDVNARMWYESKEDIKADLDRKIKIKDETEEFLSASILFGIASTGEAVPHFLELISQSVRENIKQLLPVIIFLLGIAPPAFSLLNIPAILSEIKKHRREKKITLFDKFLQLKEYWDSLNDSERKMLCYKLDKKNGLKPGSSEEYLNYIFTNKWKDVEKEINEIKEKLDGVENRLKVLESDYPKIKELLDKMSQINADINLVKNDIEFLMKEVKELKLKFDLLEKEVRELELRQQVQGVFAIADSNKFAKGSLYSYSNVRVKNSKLMIRVENSYYQIVETGGFGNSANRSMDKLRKKGIIVLNGPRGIGKSTLAASVIWNLFEKGDIRLVVKVEDLLYRNQLSLFETFIEIYHEKYEEFFGSLLVLYDPSPTTFYETTKGDVNVSPINNTVNNLFDIISRDKKVKLLIVLPTDMYSAMSKDVMEKLDEYRLDISLNHVEFLKEVIKAYSCNESPNNCCNKLSDNDFNQLASEVAKYEEGYTLIARLIGMELTKSDCNVDDIKRMIEKSEYKASAFIAGFINKWFNVIDDKGQVNIKRINALADILAIRRPFAKLRVCSLSSKPVLYPAFPILTKGIVELIDNVKGSEKKMSDEMINWLIRGSHDLIENTIERLLNGEDLGEASEPWRSISVPKMNTLEAVKYFINEYGETFATNVKKLSQFSNCWKRAALIIGATLTWDLELPDEVPSDIDALNPCKIDDYLLVDNVIPLFVAMEITLSLGEKSKSFVSIFADEYENAIDEAKKLLKRKRRGTITYALGLAFIVAEAAKLGKTINEDDADAILKITLPAVKSTLYAPYVMLILKALEPLRDKAPQRYLEILVATSQMKLDKDTARLIYDELNYIHRLMKLKNLVWPPVTAVQVYSFILRNHIMYFTDEEVEDIVGSMCDLLNALKKESNELATIAEAYILASALICSESRDFISEYCSVKDLVTRADEVRESLRELANKSDELRKNKRFKNYWVTFKPRPSQQDIREMIVNREAGLTSALALYKFDNYELDEASKLFNEAAEVYRSIENWQNYIVARAWFLHAEVLRTRSINEYVNVASNFEKLWHELLSKRMMIPDVSQRSRLSSIVLGSYLTYLASIGRYDDTEKILSEYGLFLIHDKDVLVLTKLMLRLLGFTKVAEVKPEELIDAYEDNIFPLFLPALKLTLGIEASDKECEFFNKPLIIIFQLSGTKANVKVRSEEFDYYRDICRYAFSAVKGNSDALTKLRDSLQVEILKLAQGLDGKALVQLLAPKTSRCRLALMLYALVSGNAELAKKHAQRGSEEYRLVGRLFGNVYEACCDVSSEGFKLALLKLYHWHT